MKRWEKCVRTESKDEVRRRSVALQNYSYHQRFRFTVRVIGIPVESALGLRLPLDYKCYIEVFGQGTIRGRENRAGLYIASYLAPNPALHARGFAQYFQSIEPIQYDVYPTTPGVLGFGSYADEDSLAWYTVGKPDNWPIIYHDVETGFHEIREMSLVQLILSILEGCSPLQDEIIRKDELLKPHKFHSKNLNIESVLI